MAALRDSIFQGELLMSEANFKRLFPAIEGYRLMLVEAPLDRTAEVEASVEDALADFGADAVRTAQRLAEFHRVENTYLSTFQTLGGLGLLLGTVGLAAVLLRNVLERRRELALLARGRLPAAPFRGNGVRREHAAPCRRAARWRAVRGAGHRAGDCERGGRLPLTSGGGLLLFAVFVAGLFSSLLAVVATTRAPLIESLRAE